MHTSSIVDVPSTSGKSLPQSSNFPRLQHRCPLRALQPETAKRSQLLCRAIDTPSTSSKSYLGRKIRKTVRYGTLVQLVTCWNSSMLEGGLTSLPLSRSQLQIEVPLRKHLDWLQVSWVGKRQRGKGKECASSGCVLSLQQGNVVRLRSSFRACTLDKLLQSFADAIYLS